MLFRSLFRFFWLLYCWLGLTVSTAALYVLSFFPRMVMRTFYFFLFGWWCKVFVYAPGVDLRLHQKNTQAIPKFCLEWQVRYLD